MHTLSVFPNLLDYALISPFFLRITLGIILGMMAHKALRAKLGDTPTLSSANLRGDLAVNFLELATAVLLIVGLFTQIASIASIVFLIARFGKSKSSGSMNFYEVALYATLGIIAMSLLFTGAGFLAFDLPL